MLAPFKYLGTSGVSSLGPVAHPRGHLDDCTIL